MPVSGDPNPPPFAEPIVGGQARAIEDLFCLRCGYNLRGLSGDPIPCPECGESNPLETLRTPPWVMRAALRKMETAPTVCAACMVGFMICGGITAVIAVQRGFMGADVLYGLLATSAVVVIWALLCRRMGRIYERRAGWVEVLGSFHVAGVLCTVWYPVLIGFALLDDTLAGGLPRGTFWPVFIVCVVAFGVGLRSYALAKRRIATMQRDRATRMAGEVLAAARRRAEARERKQSVDKATRFRSKA